MNNILLRRKSKIIVPTGSACVKDTTLALMLNQNIKSLGYEFSYDVIKALSTLSEDEIKEFSRSLITSLKHLVGDDVVYNPMYPNFPEDVKNADYLSLRLNALMHYSSNGEMYPSTEVILRSELKDTVKLKLISLGNEDDIREIFYNLCTSKTSISQRDKFDLEYIFKHFKFDLPEEITLKENVALIGKIYLEACPDASAEDIKKYFKTATDVLRLITAMSNGDISLEENTKFRSFKRKERRLLLGLLSSCNNLVEDMQRNKNKWIRVGERLHPSEFKSPNLKSVREAFSSLRNNEKIISFNSAVNTAIAKDDIYTTLRLLQQRPGELARRLDYLLRTLRDTEAILNAFKYSATQVSIPVLLQVRSHFMSRKKETKGRVFLPKGSAARCYYIENKLPRLSPELCDSIIAICEFALKEDFKQRPSLGTVYVSEKLKQFTVPFGQRSASNTLKTLTRGSKIQLDKDTKVLRAFIWWTNQEQTSKDRYSQQKAVVDLDLSAAIFDEDWHYKSHLSYTHLRDRGLNSYHSGDITNGGPVDGEGVSEFIDFDIDAVVALGARYVIFEIHSFTLQPFSELKHAMFGWMERQDINSGELYEPTTVQQRLSLTTPTVTNVPVIFDCKKREFIWCDMCMTLNACERQANNLENCLRGVEAIGYSMTNLDKPTLYDLLNLHAVSRGTLVDDVNEADLIFDVDKGVTPFDLDVISSQYL